MRTTEDSSIYANAKLYDILFGDYETDEGLAFYEELIGQFGEPVLELACGSGRITIPLVRKGIDIAGIDCSKDMVKLAKTKARSFSERFMVADMRQFDLGKEFSFIFVPAQAFQHLLTRTDVEMCLDRVRRHLASHGAFLVQVFNPSPAILSQSSDEAVSMSKPYYEDKESGERYYASIKMKYDFGSQILSSRYFWHTDSHPKDRVLILEMRQFFPQELDALVEYNGFEIIAKYGDTDKTPFDENPAYQHLLLKKRT